MFRTNLMLLDVAIETSFYPFGLHMGDLIFLFCIIVFLVVCGFVGYFVFKAINKSKKKQEKLALGVQEETQENLQKDIKNS